MPPEVALAGLFKLRCAGDQQPDERLPSFDPAVDLVAYAFPPGRACIALHHRDGSATAVEVRASGDFDHVIAGIGQAKLDAVAVAVAAGAHHVRPALLWASCGSAALDAVVEIACELAEVVALPWAPLRTNLAALVLDPEVCHGLAQSF
jgi:hypothetical protein